MERSFEYIVVKEILFRRIITESFYSKADLEQWLMPGIARDDYHIMMQILWEPLVEKNLSFAVKSSRDGKTIAVGLNFDLWDEPELILDSKLMVVFEFLEYLEGPIRERKLPKGKGQIIHNFMMTTCSELNPAENVIMMKKMEEYCLQLAKRKEYAGIFTTNTSPLTQVITISCQYERYNYYTKQCSRRRLRRKCTYLRSEPSVRMGTWKLDELKNTLDPDCSVYCYCYVEHLQTLQYLPVPFIVKFQSNAANIAI